VTVQEFLDQVRYQINDTDKVEYTDQELINYTNEALSWLGAELARYGAPQVLKFTTLVLTNGEADLPSDFLFESGVLGPDGSLLKSVPPVQPADQYSYKIIGNKIYSNNTSLDLFYFASFPFVSALTDLIPVFDQAVNLLREIVIFLALNRNEFNTSIEQALMKEFGVQVLELVRQTGSQNFERSIPFMI